MPRSSAAFVALLLLGACRPEAPRPEPASGPHYAPLFGQRYRTRVDLYLFAFADDDERRYLGLHDGRLPALPAEVVRDNIGRTYGAFRILDVVPVGATLTLLAETHEVTPASGIREKEGYPMGFICGLTYGGRTLDGVYAEFIQAGEHAPFRTPNQRLDPQVVARIEG